MSPKKKAQMRAWFLWAETLKKKTGVFSFGGEVGIHDLEVFQKCFFMPGCSCSLLSYFTFFEAD